jgi:SNF2 family DNA or RNA helicase
MISAELYRQGRPTIIIERNDGTSAGAWARLQEALARGVLSGSRNQTVVHADVFLAELDVLRELRNIFSEPLDLGPTLTSHLRSMVLDRRAREKVSQDLSVSADIGQLDTDLTEAGFIRTLKEFQRENLDRLLRLPHAADFSVPGAGKTTVALAAYAIRKHRGLIDRLLVIAPLAAFSAWKEDTVKCFTNAPKLSVYGGSSDPIPHDTEILLTNYHRAANDYDIIRDFVGHSPCQIVLDEAHRVKRGSDGVHGRAVLDLAYAAARRDVLTGTPAPQGANDLIALIRFMYPGQDRQILPHSAYDVRLGRDETVLHETQHAIAPYFVRTPKTRLKLPPTTFDVIKCEMSPIQSAIYDTLVGRYRAQFKLNDKSRYEMQRLGRIVMYLLEAATNPMLLTAGSDNVDEPGFAHPPIELEGDESISELLERYSNYEVPWKYEKVTSIVAEAAKQGDKVLVWTSFVRNIRLLNRMLSEFNPAVVHGGISSVEQPQPGVITRDMEFERFRHDPECTVLLANPAACSEGVSLHHWCHHAVYLDRSFNAGHFLQSQDRIHRLGLADDVLTKFTILESIDSIDDTVNGRLEDKVRALSLLMDDPGLVEVALPEPDEGLGGEAMFNDDAASIIAHIGRSDEPTS